MVVGRFRLQRRFLAATRFRALLVSDPAWTLLVLAALSEGFSSLQNLLANLASGKGVLFSLFGDRELLEGFGGQSVNLKSCFTLLVVINCG